MIYLALRLPKTAKVVYKPYVGFTPLTNNRFLVSYLPQERSSPEATTRTVDIDLMAVQIDRHSQQSRRIQQRLQFRHGFPQLLRATKHGADLGDGAVIG